jgi:glycosyltransferase involved in cell wall biosynthesis
VRAAEAWAARAASAVGVIAEGFRPHVESMGVPANRIRRVRNWTHTGEATVGREAMRAWLGLPQDACICLHAGNMGHKQGLENVVATAALAALQAPELTFVLMGEGHQRARLQAMVTERGLTNVRFLPLQSAEIFPSVLAAADVLLINQSPRVVEMSLPSKLTSYFAAGRPVVAAVAAGSETAREITWSSGGVIARPGDPADLLDAIRRVHSDPALAAHLAACGMRWAADVLSEDAALLGYEQLVAAVLAGAPRGRIHTLARQKPRLLTGVASDAPPAEERKAA